MVGVSRDAASKRALKWAAGLRAIGPCSLTITQIVRSYVEGARLGIADSAASTDLEPAVQAALLRDLREWAGDAAGVGETSYSVIAGWDRVDGHLAELATGSSIDLLVVGMHRRAGLARLWQSSVSRGVIQYAESNAACVPTTAEAEAEPATDLTSFRSVLIATDFSALGNRAVGCGYRLLRDGGTAHLLYVTSNDTSAAQAEAEAWLRALVPPDAASRGIVTEIHVLHEKQASDGICYAAARFGIDVICMGTHGRSELGGLLNGSLAQEVIHRSSQPVLLIKPEHKGA
jgi:nucleotide-binding universal stress UspA family protein